jgi:hypothetical protein
MPGENAKFEMRTNSLDGARRYIGSAHWISTWNQPVGTVKLAGNVRTSRHELCMIALTHGEKYSDMEEVEDGGSSLDFA